MKYRRLFALAAPFALAACGQPDALCTELIGGGSYCLQSTAAVAAFEAQQKVDTRFRGRSDTLIVDLEVDASGVRLVGLTPFGHKLLQLNYDNREVDATAFPDARLSPALLLAMLQLALWPADTVRSGLVAPLTLEETDRQRRILYRGEIAMTIDHDGEAPPYRRMHLAIPAADFDLTIETLHAPSATGNAP